MITSYTLVENAKSQINTELNFIVASFRVNGVDVLKLEFASVEDEKLQCRIRNRALGVIKELKRRGAVEFFVKREDFNKSTTEAVFLLNKFPELTSLVDEAGNDAVFLRLNTRITL